MSLNNEIMDVAFVKAVGKKLSWWSTEHDAGLPIR